MIDPFGFISMSKVEFSATLSDSPVHLNSSLIRPSWSEEVEFSPSPFKAIFKQESTGREFIFVALKVRYGTGRFSEIVSLKEDIEIFRPEKVIVEMQAGRKPLSFSSSAIHEWHPVIETVTSHQARATVVGGDPSFDQVRRILARFSTREDQLVHTSIRIIVSLKRQGVQPSQWDGHFLSRLREEVSEYRIGNWSFKKLQNYLALKMNATVEQVDESWLEARDGADASLLQTMSAAIEKIRAPLILRAAEEVINSGRKTMMIYGASFYNQFAPAFEKAMGKPRIQLLSMDVLPSARQNLQTSFLEM
jgi:hypothetical protein